MHPDVDWLRYVTIATLPVAPFALLPAAAAPYFVDTGLDYLHDENIGRAENGLDQLGDNIMTLSAAAIWPRVVDAHSGLLYVGKLQYDRYTDREKLSHLTASAAVTYRYKPLGGFTAIWYEANVTGAVLEHEESDIRDGALARVSLTAGNNITERILGRISYRFELRRAWEGEVFDTDNHRCAGSLDIRPAERVTLYGTLAWQTGEVVSTATPSPKVLNASEARALDEALSERAPGPLPLGNFFVGDRVAYRLDANTITNELGLNFALSQALAMDVSALHFRAYGEDDNEYDGLIVRAGLLYRF